ncbi:MAG: PIN domain-containing protein [Nanoarchaeota archaeon]|nr:PIN domain-containing protein [Nanoarchaeota archaeon]
MKLVLDNNVLFSIMNPYSVAAYLFSLIRAEFIAPEFIKKELEKHKEECIIKSNLSEHEFEIRQTEIEEAIKFFKSSDYEDFLKKSAGLISDIDDIDFLALALYIDASIWSNDPHLKEQSLVKVFTTEDLFNIMLNKEL